MSTAKTSRAACFADLIPLVYDELRVIARRDVARVRPELQLRPTEVVNEACLHLILHQRVGWQNAAHFRAIAAKKIWQVVVDQLRHHRAQKRGGSGQPAQSADDRAFKGSNSRPRRRRIPLDALAIEWRDRSVSLIDLADALDALEAKSRRLREVVMLHWFAGLSHSKVATVLGVSRSTAEKDFRYALAWLGRQLAGGR